MEEKARIFLNRAYERVDSGEFDSKLQIPFASKKLLKSLLKQMMTNKLNTGSTPVISDLDINDAVDQVRESAAHTLKTFMENGIIKRVDNKLEISEEWKKLLHIQE